MWTLAHQLVEKLWEHVLQLQDWEISKLIKTPLKLLFDDVELGNVEFLIILIHSYPDLLWKVGKKLAFVLFKKIIQHFVPFPKLIREMPI